jgi:predicted dehydrogenase
MTYRGALIGCGFFARNHMHGWADAEGAEIVAVCDLDREKAATLARDFGVSGVFTDAEAMLRDVRPDFVDVATTAESHRPLVELALSNGALTVCQKPFAGTYPDGLAMVEAAERAGRPLIVHENFRWQRAFRVLSEELGRGTVGRSQFARISFRHGYPDLYRNQPYLAEVEDFAIMDVGLHLFDVARFLLGDVERIACETQRLNPQVRGEDAFTALLRHEGGAVASVECSFRSEIAPDPFPQTLVWLEGERGTLELGFDYRIRVHGQGGVREIDGEPAVPAWGSRPWHAVQESVSAFEAHVVDVLAGRAEPQPSGRHNLGTLALALAAYRAAARRETVDVADFVAEGCRR